jgi:asparagine synthase (glutamine-hydrolysing)
MCGIAGIVHFHGESRASEALVRRMTELLAHRGPDDTGIYTSGPVSLGHRRLSIIDLSAGGHQPMANETGSVWITYNGECYNHRDFVAGLQARGHRFRSTSDTETLLALYEEQGPEFLSRIDGMFALAIWDARRRRLLLARDRLGIKPLLYYHDREHLVFASELKALLADRSVPSEISDVALADFLHLMSIPDPEGIFRGVRKLLPGHYLVVEDGRVREEAYWEVPMMEPAREIGLGAASQEFEAMFRRAVTSHLLADVPVGAFLSGGVDSGAVVAMAAGNSAKPMMSFASTFRGLSEFDESPYARQVAALYGTEHHEFDLTPNLVEALPRIVWHADEPFAISSALPLYFLAQLARQHVKVVLTGDGGDEVFAGYTWRHVDFGEAGAGPAARWRRLARWLLHGLTGRRQPAEAVVAAGSAGRDESYVRSFCCYQAEELDGLLTSEAAERIRRTWADNITQRYYDRFVTADQLRRKLYTDLKSTLVSEMLTKVDRMTMASGLEARVPFLDHHLVEWAFQIPSAHKMRGREGKLVVKKAMEQYLPSDLLYRPKHGFNVPMSVWMRRELREFVRDSLAEETVRRRGLFRPDRVTRLVGDHLDGRTEASNKILVLLMIELWFERFVDRRAELYPAGA